MKRRTLWVAGVVVLASFAAGPGTAQKAPAAPGNKEAMAVVDKLIAAMGGRKVLESIKDTTISGTVEIVQYGRTLPMTIYQKEPNKVRADFTLTEANMTFIQAFNGEKGWITDPQTGAVEEMPESQAKELARRAGETSALLHPQKAGVAYALKPRAVLEGKDYIVLEQTWPDGHKITFFLDPETSLPYKTETRTLDESGAEVDAEIYSFNYQKVSGTMVAFSARILTNGTESRRTTLAAVTYNTNLDDALFTLK